MTNIQEGQRTPKIMLYAVIALIATLVFAACVDPLSDAFIVPDTTVSISDIQGVSIPVIGEIPVTHIEETNQYTGTVTWFPGDSPFKKNVEYTAVINLKAKDRFTFAKVRENFFKVRGATTTSNIANAGSVVAVFPKTVETSGNFVYHDPIEKTYEPGLTLADLNSQLNTGYSWTAPTTVLTAGIHSFEATYTDPDGSHETVSGSIAVIVAKATGSFGSHDPIDTIYETGLILADLDLDDNYAWYIPAMVLTAGDNQSFAATYTHPSGNYEPAGGNITVNVAKANGVAAGKPVKASATKNSITINTVSAPANGQTVEYSISKNDDESSLTPWQAGLTFTGLSAGTTYYIYARSAENDNYNPGAPNVSDPVDTEPTETGTGKNIFFWLDEHGDLAATNNGVTSAAPGIRITISALDEDFDSYEWHLNGDVVLSGETEYVYVFSSWVTGKYIVGLFVEKDGGFYNTNIQITVVEE